MRNQALVNDQQYRILGISDYLFPGMPSLGNGPAICLESGAGNTHNTAHKHTDRPAQRVARGGRGTGTPGTLQLGQATRVRRAPCKVGAFPAGANPARPLSLRPEAIGAVMEVTKWLKPSV